MLNPSLNLSLFYKQNKPCPAISILVGSSKGIEVAWV